MWLRNLIREGSTDNEILMATLKIRRGKVADRYAERAESLVRESEQQRGILIHEHSISLQPQISCTLILAHATPSFLNGPCQLIVVASMRRAGTEDFAGFFQTFCMLWAKHETPATVSIYNSDQNYAMPINLYLS